MLCPRAGNQIAIAFFLREDAVTLFPRGGELSHKAFHIFFKFLVFKCKAICFLDSGIRLLLVDYSMRFRSRFLPLSGQQKYAQFKENQQRIRLGLRNQAQLEFQLITLVKTLQLVFQLDSEWRCETENDVNCAWLTMLEARWCTTTNVFLKNATNVVLKTKVVSKKGYFYLMRSVEIIEKHLGRFVFNFI